ncbi:MAG: glycosyltransferase family 39 protein, partial [Planctomycetes bacterium]|nr:glycosyltransferase family 39 protein [Planctomycetota bacterium]
RPAAIRSVSPSQPAQPGRRTVAGLLLLYGVIVLWCGARRDFWGEEADLALSVREMESSLSTAAGWLTPTRAGEPRLEHPPLLIWTAAIISRLSGLSPLLVYRLPIVLAAVLGLWITYDLARRLIDGRAGIVALAIHATSVLFFFASGWLGEDLPFAVLCQLAIAGFLRAALAGGGAGGRQRITAWLALAGASLVKSPILAAALVFLTLSLFFFMSGGLIEVKRGLAKLLRGGAWILYLAAVVPWIAFAAITRPSLFVEQHLIGVHLAPFRAEAGRSIFYYVLVIAAGFLPWTVYLPYAVYVAKDRLARHALRLGFLWLLFPLVVFSFVPEKSALYFLFAWPALALLVPAAVYLRSEKYSVWEDYLLAVAGKLLPHLLRLPIVLVLAGLGLWLAGAHRELEISYLLSPLDDPKTAALFFGALGAASAGTFFLAHRVQAKLAAGDAPLALFEAARAALLFLLAAAFVLPALDAGLSLRSFASRAEEEAQGARLATYGRERPAGVCYYLGREVEHFAPPAVLAREETGEDEPRRRLVELIRSPERVYLIASRREMRSLETQLSEFKGRIHETAVRSGGESADARGYALYSNRPEGP